MNNELKWIGIGLGIFLFLLIFFNSFTIIKTGEIGLVRRFGSIQPNVLDEGINFKVPFIDGVDKIDCKIKRLEQDMSGATKDLQDVTVHSVYNYQINKDKAPSIYREIGKDYVNVIITPTVNNITKTELSQYTAEEIITKRGEISTNIITKLNEKLSTYGISIKEFTLSNVNFSQAYTQAIENKQVAEQESKKAELELERVRAEAEQKVIEAKAEAEALKAQSQQINDGVLRLRAIEKWDGKLPTYMTDGSVPFLNIK